MELNEGSKSTQSLILGHNITALKAPNRKTGKPGTAIFVVVGAIVKVNIPFWPVDKRLAQRGKLLSQHEASILKLREEMRSNKDKFVDTFRTKGKKLEVNNAVTEEPAAPPRQMKPLIREGTRRPLRKTEHPSVPIIPNLPCGLSVLDSSTGEKLKCGEDGYLCPDCRFHARMTQLADVHNSKSVAQ